MIWNEVKNSGKKIRKAKWKSEEWVRYNGFEWYDERGDRIDSSDSVLWVQGRDWEFFEEKKSEGMTFEEILPLLKQGQVVKRKKWSTPLRMKDDKFVFAQTLQRYTLECCDILATDWELAENCDIHLLNLKLGAFKVTQMTTRFNPELRTSSVLFAPSVLFECDRLWVLRTSDLIRFFEDWEKLVKYAQTLHGEIKVKCEFRFDEPNTYSLFRLLMEGSNLKNSCDLIHWKWNDLSAQAAFLSEVSFETLLSGKTNLP
jgi:hypothetical protein